MEEKKKRWRPSLTEYRELERENKNLRNIINSLGDFETIVSDNAIYRQALMNFSAMIRAKRDPAILKQGSRECDLLVGLVYNDIKNRWDEDANKLMIENNSLSKSNKYLEKSRNELSEENLELKRKNEELSFEIILLKDRSLWKRIINKM